MSIRTIHRFIALFLIVAACNATLFVYLHFRVNEAYAEVGINAEKTAVLISKIINRTYLNDFKAVSLTMQDNTESYARLKSLLTDCRDSYGYRFAFTFKMADSKIMYLVDAEASTSTDYSPPGSVETYNPESGMYNIIRYPDRATHDTEITADPKWGKFISGYSPIFDDGRKTIGFVEVDADEDYVNACLAPVYRFYTHVFAVMNLVLAFFLTVFGYVTFSSLKKAKVMASLVCTNSNKTRPVEISLLSMTQDEPPLTTKEIITRGDDDES